MYLYVACMQYSLMLSLSYHIPSVAIYHFCGVQYVRRKSTVVYLLPIQRVFYRVRICKRLWSPGIDFEESISLAYVAWRAGTPNRVAVPSRQVGNRFLGSLKGLQIRAQYVGQAHAPLDQHVIRVNLFRYHTYTVTLPSQHPLLPSSFFSSHTRRAR